MNILNPSQSLVLLGDELKAKMLKFVEERTEVNTVTTFFKCLMRLNEFVNVSVHVLLI